MKKLIQKLIFSTLAAVFLITSAVQAGVVVPQNSSDEINMKLIKIITVSGNVEVTLIQSPTSKLSYQNEGAEKVSLKQVGNTLFVTADDPQHAAKITLNVNDIYRINASQHAVVLNKGVLTVSDLQVFLKDNAIAKLNSKTRSLYTVASDLSELKLAGATDFHTIVLSEVSKLTIEKFVALKTEMSNTSYVASRK